MLSARAAGRAAGPRPIIQSFLSRARSAQKGPAMLKLSAKRYLTAIVSAIAIGAAFSFGATQARAGDVTEDQIVNALTPAKKPLTRGLSIGGEDAKPALDPAQQKFLAGVKGRTRGLNLNEREELATIAQDKPNIDLTITFDYNSAEISSKSLGAVQTL